MSKRQIIASGGLLDKDEIILQWKKLRGKPRARAGFCIVRYIYILNHSLDAAHSLRSLDNNPIYKRPCHLWTTQVNLGAGLQAKLCLNCRWADAPEHSFAPPASLPVAAKWQIKTDIGRHISSFFLSQPRVAHNMGRLWNTSLNSTPAVYRRDGGRFLGARRLRASENFVIFTT